MTRAMIRSENLVKTFGEVRALDGLDLEVAPGVIYGFLGPNGAGKTTTLRVLAGLARADRGSAYIDDIPVRMHDRHQLSNIGVLPEEPAFYGWMTPIQYLRDFVAPLYSLGIEEAGSRASETLEVVGLAYAASRRIQGFSRGMRQRLGLAQALIHEPQVLLLDEPVSALDPAGRKDVLELIDGLRGRTTVLLSTHILADVERICDVVGIIDHGRMVIEDKRDRLLRRYARPLIEVEAEGDVESWIESVSRLPIVEHISMQNQVVRLQVGQVETAQRELLGSLAQEDLRVRRFELIRPSLEDVFLQLTQSVNRDR